MQSPTKDVGQSAVQGSSQHSGTTGGIGSEIRSDAERLSSTASNRIHSELDARKGTAASQVRSISTAIGQAAEGLDQGAPQWLRSAFQQGAQKAQRLADSLEQKDSRQILNDVQELARNNPGAFMAGCAALGFAAARIFKAGAPDESSPTQSRAGQLPPIQGEGPGSVQPPQTLPHPEPGWRIRMNEDTKFMAAGKPTTRSTAQGPASAVGDNIVDLVKQLATQGSHLAEQQLTLVKAEVREATGELKTAIGSMLGAAVVGIAGLGVVLMGLAYLLGDAINNLGLATLIVGLATLAIAYVLYSSGSKKMSATHLAPERSQRTLERTPDIARGDLHTETTR